MANAHSKHMLAISEPCRQMRQLVMATCTNRPGHKIRTGRSPPYHIHSELSCHGSLRQSASHESTRKLPKVLGHLVETLLASTPEMILLLTLLCKKQYTVIQAAVLGSILATLLLCLGMCFLCGGLIYSEQTFNGAVSELESDLLLTA